MTAETNKDSVAAEQFIGPRRVVGITPSDKLTNGGAEIVEVLYDGGFKELMPTKAFNVLVTAAPTDYNALGKRKIGDLTKKLLTVLAEHDIRAGEIEALKTSLENELYNSFNRVTHYLWTKDDASFTPGFNVILDRSLLEADIIIKSIPQKPDAAKTTTDGAAEKEAAGESKA